MWWRMRLSFRFLCCRCSQSKSNRPWQQPDTNKTFFFSYTAALFLQRLHLLRVLSALYNIAKKTNFVKQICVLTNCGIIFIEIELSRLCRMMIFCENRTISSNLSGLDDSPGNKMKDDNAKEFCKRAELLALFESPAIIRKKKSEIISAYL